MKKTLVLSVSALLLLSSCGSYTGMGAYTGGSFGSIIGSAIVGLSLVQIGADGKLHIPAGVSLGLVHVDHNAVLVVADSLLGRSAGGRVNAALGHRHDHVLLVLFALVRDLDRLRALLLNRDVVGVAFLAGVLDICRHSAGASQDEREDKKEQCHFLFHLRIPPFRNKPEF